MTFTDELWHSIEPIYAAILRHPFIAGLTDGSLPRESFEFYAVQDALYLREFARSLALAAARAPKDEWIIMLSAHAAGALRVERTLPEGFFQEFKLCSMPPTRSPRVSGMPSAPRCAAISGRRAVTSGCSGTWAGAPSAGRSNSL